MTNLAKRYRVIGHTFFRGFGHGAEFDAELSAAQEERAVQRGAIEVVNDNTKQEEEGDEDV
jgi:hypothetical protein